MISPLHQHDIQYYISHFLDRKDIFNCIQVCRAWRDSFIPILYYEISDTSETSYNVIPPIESTKKYTRFVKKLTFDMKDNFKYLDISFCNLVVLSVDFTESINNNQSLVSALFKLIRQNKNSITDFRTDLSNNRVSNEIWESLSECHRIRFIVIYDTFLDQLSISSLLKTFTYVRVINISYITMDRETLDLGSFESPLCFPNLTKISYEWEKGEFPEIVLLKLVQRSPNLKKLRLVCNEVYISELVHPTCIQEYRSTFSPGSLANIKEIELVGILSDDDTAHTLKAIPNTTRLHFSLLEFGKNSYDTLKNIQANSIVALDICHCDGVSSAMVQGILSGCPSLEDFVGRYIRGTDLVKINRSYNGDHQLGFEDHIIVGQDWVCVGLSRLQLFFDLSSSDANIDRGTDEGEDLLQKQQHLEQFHSFRQLSRLINLEHLNVGTDYPELKSKTTLKLKLKSQGGELEQLKTLTVSK